MNEEYVKQFVENFKKHLADTTSVKIELETILFFKDQEIAALRKELEEAKANAKVIDEVAMTPVN